MLKQLPVHITLGMARKPTQYKVSWFQEQSISAKISALSVNKRPNWIWNSLCISTTAFWYKWCQHKSLTCCASIHSWPLLTYCSSYSQLRIHRWRRSYPRILGSTYQITDQCDSPIKTLTICILETNNQSAPLGGSVHLQSWWGGSRVHQATQDWRLSIGGTGN